MARAPSRAIARGPFSFPGVGNARRAAIEWQRAPCPGGLLITAVDWAAVGAVVSATLTGVTTAAVKWIIPGVRALQQAPPPLHHESTGERRAEARDFGTMLERLGNLAEQNREQQAAAAQDREDIRDALRSLGAASAMQTKVLENLVKITDAALVASTANSKILQALEQAGAEEAITTVLNWRQRQRRRTEGRRNR